MFPALECTVPAPADVVDPAVRTALGESGFGVLTEIDVAAVLKAKIGLERPGLRILGACNPHLAARALEVRPDVSLVLPCNVVLEEVPGGTRVAIPDPAQMFDGPELADVAADARNRLQAALDRTAAAVAAG